MKAINNDYLLAIDQGTTGTRAFIFDSKGLVVSSAYQEIKQHYPKPGWVEHDALDIWQSVIAVISSVVSGIDVKKIKAIGITNQRETTILWDKKTGKPLHRAIVWQDRRTASICAHPHLKKKSKLISFKTGLRLDPYFCATKIQWLIKNVPSITKKVKSSCACFGTVDAWLIHKLTGQEMHVTDMTNASRTLLFNIRTKKWDDQILKIFGIPKEMLPRVLPSGDNFGHTKNFPGLPDGIPITAVMGDQQASLYGQGCFKVGDIKNTYGTGCFMVLNTGKKLCSSKTGLLTTIACDVLGNPVYALEGSVFVAGAAVQWLRDELKIIKNSAQTEEIVSLTHDNGGVYFVPAFVGLGAPYWQPNARGIIYGLTRGTNVGHIVRATLEAMAYQTKDVFLLMKDSLGKSIKELRVDGGASANDFLMQFQADILGIAIVRPKQLDTTVWGIAQLAGVKAGMWTAKDLKSMQAKDRVFLPRMKKTEALNLYNGWKDAVKRVL